MRSAKDEQVIRILKESNRIRNVAAQRTPESVAMYCREVELSTAGQARMGKVYLIKSNDRIYQCVECERVE